METPKCPQIQNLDKITPEQAKQYVKFVATLRHQQKRFFTFRTPELLQTCKQMETELDKLNADLLDPNPKLF